MKTILKSSILAFLFISTSCLATLPEHPEELNFEQLKTVVDGLQLKKEDCQVFLLQDMHNEFLTLINNEKVPLNKAMPYAKKVAQQIKDCKKARLAHVNRQ